jgi:hypothetical protein
MATPMSIPARMGRAPARSSCQASNSDSAANRFTWPTKIVSRTLLPTNSRNSAAQYAAVLLMPARNMRCSRQNNAPAATVLTASRTNTPEV